MGVMNESKRWAEFKDLDWFRIDNYKFINELTISAVLKEVLGRRRLIKDIDILEYSKFGANPDDGGIIKKRLDMVFSGNPQIFSTLITQGVDFENEMEFAKSKSVFKKSNLTETPYPVGFESEIIRLLRKKDIINCYESITKPEESIGKRIEGGEWEGEESLSFLRFKSVDGVQERDILASHCIPKLNDIYLSIKLNATDDEIINSLKVALPIWRSEYHECYKCFSCGECHECHEYHKCSQCRECKKYRECKSRKIDALRITYKNIHAIYNNYTIPIMDLYLWARYEHVKLKNTDIERKLYNQSGKSKALTNNDDLERQFLKPARMYLGITGCEGVSLVDKIKSLAYGESVLIHMNKDELYSMMENNRALRSNKRS